MESFRYDKCVKTEKELIGFIAKVWKRVYREGATFCEGDKNIFVIVYCWDDLGNIRLVVSDDNSEFLLDRLPLSYLTLCCAHREEIFADWGRLLS